MFLPMPIENSCINAFTNKALRSMPRLSSNTSALPLENHYNGFSNQGGWTGIQAPKPGATSNSADFRGNAN
jgi:hypothetical protein